MKTQNIIIFLFVALLIAAGSSFATYQYLRAEMLEEELETAVVPSEEEPEEDVVTEDLGPVFRNQEFGFQLAYKDGLTEQDCTKSEIPGVQQSEYLRLSVAFDTEIYCPITYLGDGPAFLYQVAVVDEKVGGQWCLLETSFEKRKTSVDGVEAYECAVDYFGDIEGFVTVFDENGYYYLLSAYDRTNSPSFREDYEEFVESFEFI